jgi:uncharacterized coiled-coil DUF342 family protein
MTTVQLLLIILSACGVVICGLTSLVVALVLKRFDNIATQLKELTKAINAFVKREECNASMGEHCSQLRKLRDGFEENKTAIRQILNELKRHHGIDITYNK